MYRREFLRRSALAAASVAVFACAPSATVPAASAALKPVKGGTLTWGLWDKIDVIDPALTTGAAAGEIAQNILDTLITIDSDQKLYPALASKWTITDSSKTFTFTLRDGVKFHDGSTLTSAAVKGSFDRILDPKTKAGAVVSLVGPIDKITTPDDKTVVILGAGGAAKAAVAALKEAKKVEVLSRREIPHASNRPCDLLINATPVGMFPMVDASPLPGPIPANVVLDMVYNPPITRLLRSALDQGKTVIQGTTMFLAQAARQFEIWTGHRAPSEIFEEKIVLS